MSRYQVVRGQDRDWLVVDQKSANHKVICVCRGWDAPDNAQYIVQALEAWEESLYKTFSVKSEKEGGSHRQRGEADGTDRSGP